MFHWFKSWFRSKSSPTEDAEEALFRAIVPHCSQPKAHNYEDTTQPSSRDIPARTPFTLTTLHERLASGNSARQIKHGHGRPLPNPKLGQGWEDALQPGGYRVTEFALRGSRRCPVEVFRTKGFRPKEDCYRPELLSSHGPNPHVEDKLPNGEKAIGSLFVSFSRSLKIAKSYALQDGNHHFVYVARVRGAIDFQAYLKATGSQTRTLTQELLAYVAVPWTDVLAYRDLTSEKVWTNNQFNRLSLTDDDLEKAIKLLCTGSWQS